MTDDFPTLATCTLPLDAPLVAAHLAERFANRLHVMLDANSRHHGSRSHLVVHKDANGWFVRTGRRGSCKEYLGRCHVSCFEGGTALFAYTTVSSDNFFAEQRRRYDAKYGIAPE